MDEIIETLKEQGFTDEAIKHIIDSGNIYVLQPYFSAGKNSTESY